MSSNVSRPNTDEYAQFYAGYVDCVPEGDIFTILEQQIERVREKFLHFSDEQALFRFSPNDWSIKEMLGHMCDGEHVFSYRAMRISRNDATPLMGFEQDDYVREANFDARLIGELVQQFELQRRATLLMFKDIPMEVSMRRGIASGFEVSVRALLYILAGHVNWHLDSLENDYVAKM